MAIMDAKSREIKMLKVVVFDSGWGGDIVAQDLEDNLAVVEVIRVIDWKNAPYADKSRRKICRLTESALRPYIGEVDVIVIASFEAMCAAKFLKARFPYQKFVTMRWPREWLSGRRQHTIMVLTGEKVKHSWDYYLWKRQFKSKKIIEPACEHWTPLIDEGTFTPQFLQRELAFYKNAKIDTIVLGNTHFWDLQSQIENALGWQATVVEPRQYLIDRVGAALNLEGMNYSKQW